MAHFAKIDEDNLVTQVIVVNNNELLQDGVELEAKGVVFCQNLFGGNWVQTSFNKTFRKNFASVGFYYDEVRDAFIPPQPCPSCTLDETTCNWVCNDEI